MAVLVTGASAGFGAAMCRRFVTAGYRVIGAARRAGKLAGKGCVAVKVAMPGHDMRWDIPVVGLRTLESLRKSGATCLGVEAHRAIVLQRAEVVAEAGRRGIAIEVLDPGALPTA